MGVNTNRTLNVTFHDTAGILKLNSIGLKVSENRWCSPERLSESC
jgi:hypothetical protein